MHPIKWTDPIDFLLSSHAADKVNASSMQSQLCHSFQFCIKEDVSQLYSYKEIYRLELIKKNYRAEAAAAVFISVAPLRFAGKVRAYVLTSEHFCYAFALRERVDV